MQKYNKLLYKIILAVTFFLNVFIFIGAIVNAHDALFTDIFSSAMRLAMPVMLAVIICMFITLLYHSYNVFNQRQLIVCAGIMFGIMALILAVIICNFRVIPYSDARNVQDMAMYLVKTGKRQVDSGAPHAMYFARYSNNYFLTIVFVYLFKIFEKLGIQDIYAGLQILTAAGVMIAAVFTFLTGVKICGIRGGVKVLTLCVLNPVYYVLALWVYTNVISIPFMMAVIYFGICIYQEKRFGYLAGYCIMEAISSVIGFFIRPTVVIPLIALIICAFLKGCADRKAMYKLLQCSVICVIAGMLIFQSVSSLNDSYFSAVSEGNFPIAHWIMMGSHNDGKHNLKDVEYTKSFGSKEEKEKRALKKTIENYRSRKLSGTVSFLGDKLLFSWGHGDGEEILLKASQDKKQTKLYSWLVGDRQDLFRLYCYSFRIANVFLIMAAIWNLLKKKGIDAYQFMFVLSLFGGILFYCFWEVKGSYTAPFIYIMLLIGMRGGNVLADGVPKWNFQSVTESRSAIFGAIMIMSCMICICMVSYYGMTETDIKRQDKSLYCSRGNSADIVSDDEVADVSQEFYASKPMNRIVLGARIGEKTKDLNAGYRVELLEEGNREVYAGEIYAEDIKPDGTVVLEMREIAPKHKMKYVLHLQRIDETEGMIYFKQQANEYMDAYEGELIVNGESRVNDMHLEVYKEYKSKWCSRKTGFVINGCILLSVVFIFLWLWSIGKTKLKRTEGR